MDDDAQDIQLRDPPDHLLSPHTSSSTISSSHGQPHIPSPAVTQANPTGSHPSIYVTGYPSYAASLQASPRILSQPPLHYPYLVPWWYPQNRGTPQSTPYLGYNTYQDPVTTPYNASPYPTSITSYPQTDGLSEETTPVLDQTPREVPIASSSTSITSPAFSRTPWVMWVGNLPSKTTNQELHQFLGSEDANIVSIFVMRQSNCAFVNFNNEDALHRSVARYHGQKLRPDHPRCPDLVCRVRTAKDDFNAGVGGQRKAHVHKDTVRSKSRVLTEGEPLIRDYGIDGPKNSDSECLSQASSNESTDSTSSSILGQHFPQRFFILKSFGDAELDESVRTGLWSTQVHNEVTLNRAFRTSKDVILFLSGNGSGAFYGYARMSSAIGDPAESGSSPSLSSSHDQLRPRASSEPSLSSAEPVIFRSPSAEATVPIPSRSVAKTSKGKQNSRPHLSETDRSSSANSRSIPFQIEWLCTTRLPFRKTRHITNPWSDGREVKISRDGTEVHPESGNLLLETWAGMIQATTADQERKKNKRGGFSASRRP